MELKIVLLFLVAVAVTKACDLDWVLEDIYDDIDSSEDEATEKPSNNNNSSPSTTTQAPNESASINTKPFPIVPTVVDSAPGNNSAPTNSSSRAFTEKSGRKRRHRKTHHRRRLIRRVPVKGDDDKIGTNEGRGFNSDSDFETFASIFRKIPADIKEDVSDENSSNEEVPQVRTVDVEFEENNKERDQLYSDDLLRYLKSRIEKVYRDDFVSIDEVPTETTDIHKKIDEEEEFEEDKRSFLEDDSFPKEEVIYIAMPKSKINHPEIKQKDKKIEELIDQHLIQRLFDSNRRNIKKRVQTPKRQVSKYTLKWYLREYLKKLIIRDIREKTKGEFKDSEDFVYVPIPKKILIKQFNDAHATNSKVVSHSPITFDHEHKHLDEIFHPSVTETKKNGGLESFLLVFSKNPPAKSEKDGEVSSTIQHLFYHKHNPQESDIHDLEEEPKDDIKHPSHTNHVKEHIIRETFKIDPTDHSEIRNVHEQTRLSIIKSPHVPIELSIESHGLSNLQESDVSFKEPIKEKNEENKDKVLTQQLPQTEIKTFEFNQKFPAATGNNQEIGQKPKLLFQELPLINPPVNFLQGFFPPLPIINRFGEGQEAAGPKPSDPKKLSDIYLQAQSYPIKYPINNPVINKTPHSPTATSEIAEKAIGEENFYLKPSISDSEASSGKPNKEGTKPIKHAVVV